MLRYQTVCVRRVLTPVYLLALYKPVYVLKYESSGRGVGVIYHKLGVSLFLHEPEELGVCVVLGGGGSYH